MTQAQDALRAWDIVQHQRTESDLDSNFYLLPKYISGAWLQELKSHLYFPTKDSDLQAALAKFVLLCDLYDSQIVFQKIRI